MISKALMPFRILIILIVLFALPFASCKKEEEEPYNEDNELYYDFMKEWYFWTDEIPAINPSSYNSIFDVLEAVRYRELDRWSYIMDYQDFLAYFQDSRVVGYGFGSKFDSAGKLRIAYIFNTVDMYEAGVRRSWIIEAVNGVAVNPGMNVNQMLGANEVGVSNTFRFRTPEGEIEDITLQKKELVMNTVLHHEVIERSGIKVGYMVLQGFTTPTVEELQGVFAEFSLAGIDELILDMRYNGGGSVATAIHLTSMIGGPSLAGETFAKYRYNSNKGEQYNRVEEFISKDTDLQLNRLITIGTRATASASELVINSLRPFMDVHIVGDNTYGKPMGSNVFNFKEIYALAPITFALYNANDEGEYFDGLPVDVPAPDDLSRMFGDPDESSLQQALAFIEMGITKGMPVAEPLFRQPWEDMTGIRRELRMH